MVDEIEKSEPHNEVAKPESNVVWFLRKGTTTYQVTDAAKVERLKAAGWIVIPAEEGMRLWEGKRRALNTFLDIERRTRPEQSTPPLPKAPDEG